MASGRLIGIYEGMQMDGFCAKTMSAVCRSQSNQMAGTVSPWVKSMGVCDKLASVPGLTNQHLVALGEHAVRSLDDLADLASDELMEIVGEQNMTQRQADSVIIAARAHWFVG